MIWLWCYLKYERIINYDYCYRRDGDNLNIVQNSVKIMHSVIDMLFTKKEKLKFEYSDLNYLLDSLITKVSDQNIWWMWIDPGYDQERWHGKDNTKFTQVLWFKKYRKIKSKWNTVMFESFSV